MKKNNFINSRNIVLIVVAVLALVALIIGIVSVTKKDNKTNSESKKIVKKFDETMGSKTKKIIYYGSSTCSYCELQTPIMKQIKKDYKIEYFYIDAKKLSKEDNKYILNELDIEGSTPTIAIVKDNEVIDVNVGYMDGKNTVEFFKQQGILKDDATYKPEENLTFINYSQYKDIVDNKDISVVVIGQTTCSHCISAKPVLSRVAGNNNITINYLNLTEMTDDDQKSLISNLKEMGYAEAENLGTPLTLIIENKKVVGFIEGENPPSYFTREFKKYGVIK